MIRRRNYLKRSAPPRKRRPGKARRGPWRNESKRRWISEQPSLINGRSGVQCCHVVKGGKSQKGGDEWTVPLTPDLHDQLDGRVKLPNGEYGNRRMADGRYRFEHFYDVDLIEEAIRLHVDWMEEEKRLGNTGNFSSSAAAD